MTRTKITRESGSWCRIEYDNQIGDRIRLSLFAPSGGGYVRMSDGRGGDKQICDKLGSRGATMLWHPSYHPTLADYVRSEYRAMRRAERADRERY